MIPRPARNNCGSQRVGDVRVRVIRQEQELAELETEWDEMIQDSGFRAPFHSWVWYAKWWKHFGKGNELFIVVVEELGGRILAVAPLMKAKIRLRGMNVSEIRFASNGITPRSSVLYRNGVPARQWASAIAECLSNSCDEWDMITLENIDANVPYFSELYECGKRCGMSFIEVEGKQSPYIEINKSFEQYMTDNFSRTGRRGVKRKVNRLAKNPDYRVMEFRDSHDMQEALDSAFRVSKGSWKGKVGADMSGSGSRKSFYVDITNTLALLGQVRIWVSFLGTEPIAVQYFVVCEKNVYFFITDFDERYSEWSPGTALLYEVIKSFHEEQVEEFDFTGGLYNYKKIWATGVRRHVTLEIFHNKTYSHLLYLGKTRLLPMLRKVKHMILR